MSALNQFLKNATPINTFNNVKLTALNEFLSKATPIKNTYEDDRPLEAFSQGYGNMMTLGYLPQLQAKMEPITDRIFNLFTGKNVEPASWEQLLTNNKDYLESRDSNIRNIEGLKESNPYAYYGGSAAGLTNMALMTPTGITPELQRAFQFSKGLKSKTLAAQAAKLGTALGFLSNPGDVEGMVNELQLGSRLGNAIIGLIGGYGAQVGIDKIAKYSTPLAKKILSYAEMKAARALGLERATQRKIGEKAVQKVGRYALDEDIVTPLSGTRKMMARNEATRQKGGKMMEEAYTAIDEAAKPQFDPTKVAQDVTEELGGFWRSPINKGEAAQLDNMIEAIIMRGGDTAEKIPLKVAQELKQEIGKVANWKNNLTITDKERMARDAYGIISKAIDDAAEKGAKSINKSGIVEKLTKGKELYAGAKTAETLLEKRLAREQGNKFFGLTDWIAGGAAFAVDPKLLALVGVKKIAERYGNQVISRTLDKVGKEMLKIPAVINIANKNPVAFQALVYNTASNYIKNKTETSNINQIKGKDKWIAQGLEKIVDNKINFKDPKIIKKLIIDKKGQDLLIDLSGAKENTKRFTATKKKLNDYLNQGI